MVSPRARTSGAKKSKSTRGAKGTRVRLEVDARRAQLVEMGLEMFAGQSYDALSIEEVAQRAGVSKGLLYHYFPTKRDFYCACLEEAAGRLMARTEVDKTLTPLASLERGLDAYLQYVAEHGPAYLALMRGGIGSDPAVAAIVQRTRGAYLKRLLDAIGTHEPPPLLRTALWGWVGFVESASLDWVEHRDLARESVRDLLVHELLQLFLRVGGELPAPRG